MSKTHLIKNTIKKYLYHYENKIESSKDKAILEYFLSDDTIILSKKMLKKYIKVKELSDEILPPPHLLRFEEIEKWKEECEPKPFVDIKIAKDRYVTVFSKKREIYLDLKIQQSYVDCENVEKFIKEWKQHEPLADDFFLTALENMPD